TVNVARTPPCFCAMQMPSKTWTRSLSPSLIFTCTLTVSPGLKLGRSVRSCCFSTISNAFINSPTLDFKSPGISPVCFSASSALRLRTAIYGPPHDRPKSVLRALSIHETLPDACSEDALPTASPTPDRKTNHAIRILPYRRHPERTGSLRLQPLRLQSRR